MPNSQGRSGARHIEQRQLVVDAHEHLVDDVFQISLVHAEAPQAVPNVAELSLKDGASILGRVHAGLGRGGRRDQHHL